MDKPLFDTSSHVHYHHNGREVSSMGSLSDDSLKCAHHNLDDGHHLISSSMGYMISSFRCASMETYHTMRPLDPTWYIFYVLCVHQLESLFVLSLDQQTVYDQSLGNSFNNTLVNTYFSFNNLETNKWLHPSSMDKTWISPFCFFIRISIIRML